MATTVEWQNFLIEIAAPAWPVIGTLIGVSVGAWLNQRFEKRRFEDERNDRWNDRLWGFRKDSYTLILQLLKSAIEREKAYKNTIALNGYDIHGQPNFPPPSSEIRALRSDVRECQSEIDKQQLILSEDFVQKFKEIEPNFNRVDEEAGGSEHNSPNEVQLLDSLTAELEKTLANLTLIAKGEISPQGLRSPSIKPS